MFTVTTSHHAFLRYHLRFVAIPFALEWLGQLADTGTNEKYYILAAIAMLAGGSALMVGARFRN